MAPVPKKIIIVEDEPDTAEMFAEMIRLNGYRVIKSYGGRAAVDTIIEIRPAAVVLDIMMPGLSGIDVLGIIRQDPQLAKIPVIIVSARGLPSDIRSGIEAGAFMYLTKPVAYSDLKQAIVAALGEDDIVEDWESETDELEE